MRIHVPPNPNALQKAIDNGQPDQVLVLQNGEDYGRIMLPGRNLGGLNIECDGFNERFGRLRRIQRDANLPRITSDSWRQWPIQSSYGSGGINFAGLRILNMRTDNEDHPTYCVALGHGHQDHAPATEYNHLSRDVVLDRCWIGGIHERQNTHAGVLANAERLRIDGCIIDGIVHGTHETHGIEIEQTRGEVTIVNTEICASGINILCGGASPRIPGMTNCINGLSVRDNLLYKSLDWFGSRHGVKCLFELKNCWKANVTHNIMRHCWEDAQNGMAVLFTPREHNPAMYGQPPRPAPLTHVGDIEFSHNVVQSVDGGINILAADNSLHSDGQVPATAATGHLNIHDNCFVDIGAHGKNGTSIQVACTDVSKPIQRLNLLRNVFLHHPLAGDMSSKAIFFEGTPPAIVSLSGCENKFTLGKYGFFESGDHTRGKQLLEKWSHKLTWNLNLEVPL